MSSPIPFPPPGFDELSKEEQLNYVEELANYVGPEAEETIPEWHWRILAERMATSSEDLEHGIPWEEFKQELEQELRQS